MGGTVTSPPQAGTSPFHTFPGPFPPSVPVPQGCWSRNLPPNALLVQAPGLAAGTAAQPVSRQPGSLPARHSHANAGRGPSTSQTPTQSCRCTAQPLCSPVPWDGEETTLLFAGKPARWEIQEGFEQTSQPLVEASEIALVFNPEGKQPRLSHLLESGMKSPAAPGSPRAIGKECKSSKRRRALDVFHDLLCCKLILHPLNLIPSQLLPLALTNFCFTKLSPPARSESTMHSGTRDRDCPGSHGLHGATPRLCHLWWLWEGVPTGSSAAVITSANWGCPLWGDLQDQARRGHLLHPTGVRQGQQETWAGQGWVAVGSSRHSCCTGPSASTARHGWAALCSPAVRRAQQLPAKTGRAAIVTMTMNLSGTRRGQCGARNPLAVSDEAAQE